MGYSVYYTGEVSVTPPLSKEHTATLMELSKSERTDATNPILAAISASAEPDLPGYGGLLEVAGEGSLIVPEEGESRHGVRLWLRLLIEHFFGPLGYVLGARSSGRGTIPKIAAAFSSATISSRPLTISSRTRVQAGLRIITSTTA